MTSVLHVLDRTCDETVAQVVEMVRARLSTGDQPHGVVAIDPEAGKISRRFIQAPVAVAPRLLPSRFVNFSPAIAGRIASDRPALVHAWGVEAAATCASYTSNGVPLVLTLQSPGATPEAARWIRSFPSGAVVVAGSQYLQSRLLTVGLPPDRVVVLRGAVDFGAINKARRENVRDRVVGHAKPVVLLPGPASRADGQQWAVWAAGIVQFLYPGMRVLLPYDSRESRRLVRWVRTMRREHLIIRAGDNLSWPELVACADVFLQPATNEVCVDPIAHAMAAGIPIVASAVRSIAELIADKHNGLLVKDADPRRVAARLLTAIEDAPLVRQVTDTARGQAFEVFGARAFADNYRRLYDNVIAGRSASDGVADTAEVA